MKNYSKYIFTALLAMVSAQFAFGATDGEGGSGKAEDYVKLFKKTEYVPVAQGGTGDTYRITLDSYVTGTSTFSNVVKPVDLVLVLDVSTSMSSAQGSQYLLKNFVKLTTGDNIGILHTEVDTGTPKCNYAKTYTNDGKSGTLRYRIKIGNTTYNLRHFSDGWYYGTGTGDNKSNYTKYTRNNAADEILTDVKIDLLQEATRVFIKQIETSALGPDGKKGTADDVDHRIGFATFCGNLTQWTNIVPVFTNVSYHNGGSNAAVAGTVSMDAFVNQLHLHMGSNTAPSNAFTQAKTVFDNLWNTYTDEQKANRSRVTVMFTDGEPTNGVDTNIKAAKPLKDGFGTLFTVGIFSNAQKEVDGVTIENYMKYVSSYYPTATGSSRTNRGNMNSDGVEYYQESDGSDLSAIFKSIAEASSADTYQVGAYDAAAIDVMSSDFELPKLPGGAKPTITWTMWTCIGTTSKPDGDVVDASGNITTKYRGGYEFVPYVNNANDDIYDGDTPTTYVHYAVDTDPDDRDRVIVNGFNYSKDDDLLKDSNNNLILDGNGKPQLDKTTNPKGTYGNWVGKHKDGTVTGKMLSFNFDVELKSSSMGGFGLPSNESTSGIYIVEKKDDGTPKYDTEGNPVFTEEGFVIAYPEPVVDVPSIIIIKDGLKYGDSAIFTVTRKTNASGTELTPASTDYMQYTVMLTQDDEDSKDLCYVVIKDLEAGIYEVEENTLWAWTYTPDKDYSTDGTKIIQSRKLSQPVIPEGETIEDVKASVSDAQKVAGYGKTNVEGWDSEAKRYYVLGNALHLMFRFNNSPIESGLSLHDEAVAVNVFGNGGGSAEHGGTDPEVEL